MSSHKYLAWFVSLDTPLTLNALFNNHPDLIEKFCNSFEKVYLVNFSKLKFFSNKEHIQQEFDKKFKKPKNMEFVNPKNVSDFDNFMKGKELIAINNMGRQLNNLKIHFLLARYKIKLMQISNIGNIQWNAKLNFFSWRALIYKLDHDFANKLVVFLSNFKLVPKREIRFLTNSNIIKNSKIGFIKKILNRFNLLYAKELILVNSRSFDLFKECKFKIEESQIVLLDQNLEHHERIKLYGHESPRNVERHYFYLNKLLQKFSNLYNKRIVICIHPGADLEKKKKYFPNYEVVQYKTRENIYKAFIVLYFATSAIVDALLLKKRIVSLYSNYNTDKSMFPGSLKESIAYGILLINIEDEKKIDKDKFLLQLNNRIKNYSNYIKSNIAPDEDNLGYKKMIRILKERFF